MVTHPFGEEDIRMLAFFERDRTFTEPIIWVTTSVMVGIRNTQCFRQLRSRTLGESKPVLDLR